MATVNRHVGIRTWIKRLFVGLLVGILALVVGGMAYESIASAMAWRNYPSPGQMVDVGGYRLHVNVTGEDRGKPTVILDHGGTAMSIQWGWVQQQLASHTRVVVYDRPGQGWSDPSPEQLEAQEAVRDLYAALQQMGVEGPYLLVGHSMGALMVRVFAHSYPNEVAGLILVDPRDVGWENLLGIEEGEAESFLTLMSVVSRLGILRLSGLVAQSAEGLPPQQFAEAAAIMPSHRHWKGARGDAYLGDSATALLQRIDEDLADAPLVVVSATEAGSGFDSRQREALIAHHADMAVRSSRGMHHTIQGSDHTTIVTHEEYAQEISNVVLDMLNTVKEQ